MLTVVTDYTFDNLDVEESILRNHNCEVISQKAYQGPEKLAELVRNADYVITQFAPVTSEIIEAMEKAKIIVRYGIGVDNVDLDAATAKGIPVCNVPDFCIDEVADHTLAMMLALTRGIVPGWDIVRQGKWKLAVPLDQMHVLREMTVGLVAYGKIAREVAIRLKAFKCKVMAYDPVIEDTVIEADGVIPATLDQIYAQSDIISLHCPSTQKTQYMINAESIKQMKKGAILINTSRGTLVKTDDLIAALQDGLISAAALDVTDPEPINTDSPLLKMPNVIINSHTASISTVSIPTLRRSVANLVVCAVKGEKLYNIVNRVNR